MHYFRAIADACQFQLEGMYLLPSLESRFRPAHFKTVSELVKSKVPKLFLNALEGSGSTSDSDTEMVDLTVSTQNMDTNGEGAIKREKMVFLTYLSSLSVYSSCSVEPHILEFLPILSHYANDTKDEELRNQCTVIFMHVMSVVPVLKQNLHTFLKTIGEVSFLIPSCLTFRFSLLIDVPGIKRVSLC
jgi:hypothetical protein